MTGRIRRQGGVTREVAPGTFYLYETAPQPGRLFKLALFWIIVILIPIFIIQFSGK